MERMDAVEMERIYENDSTNWEKQILRIYPPTTVPTQHILVITILLTTFHVLGTCGNASQLALQWYTKRLHCKDSSNSSYTLFQIYICVLHVANFCISVLAPLITLETLIKIWMFGMPTCISYLVTYTAGRALAAWAIALIFLQHYKRKQSALEDVLPLASGTLILVALAVSVPSVFFLKVTEIILYEEQGQDPDTLLQVRTFKCSARYLNSSLMVANGFGFVIEFLLPLIIILWSYCRRPSSTPLNSQRQILRDKTTLTLVTLAIFNFIALLPRWLLVFSTLFRTISGTVLPHWFNVVLEDCDLVLPGANASLMWIPAKLLSSYYASCQCLDGTGKNPQPSNTRKDSGGKVHADASLRRKAYCYRARTLNQLNSQASRKNFQEEAEYGIERTNSLPLKPGRNKK